MVSDIQKLSDANSTRGLRTFVVMMGGPETKGAIDKMTTENKITIPVTFLPGGPSAPDVAGYRINPEAKNTVLVWRGQTVRGNFVNVTPAKWPEVVKAAEGLLQ
ncbi:MAG: hypothetical protein K0Q72_3673 [Armatimonadetes bacterium]|nr:hypothetical protein [Armatimonadota bacterium]